MQHDRAIDDPGLNQDSTFDKRDNENFDDSNDFHKNDDTSQDKMKRPEQKKNKSMKDMNLNRKEQFDGDILI